MGGGSKCVLSLLSFARSNGLFWPSRGVSRLEWWLPDERQLQGEPRENWVAA